MHRELMVSLKSIKSVVIKSKNSTQSYVKLANEVLLASNLRGDSVDRKTDMQKRILLNKHYLVRVSLVVICFKFYV